MAIPISQFRNRVIVEVPKCPTPRIDTAVIDALRKFCEDTWIYDRTFEEADIDHTTRIDENDNYSITLDISTYTANVDPLAPTYFTIDNVEWEIRELTLENQLKDTSQVLASETKYFNFPDSDSIKLFSFKDWGQDLDIFIKLAVMPKLTVTEVEDKFFNEPHWRDAIIALTAAELQSMPGRPWTNYKVAGVNYSRYNACMGDAKIQALYGGTTGNIVITGGFV